MNCLHTVHCTDKIVQSPVTAAVGSSCPAAAATMWPGAASTALLRCAAAGLAQHATMFLISVLALCMSSLLTQCCARALQVRHKYDSVRMYWVPHFGGACYCPNVLLRCEPACRGSGGGQG